MKHFIGIFGLALSMLIQFAHSGTCQSQGYNSDGLPEGPSYVLFNNPTEFGVKSSIDRYGEDVWWFSSEDGFLTNDHYNVVELPFVWSKHDVTFNSANSRGDSWVVITEAHYGGGGTPSEAVSLCKDVVVQLAPFISTTQASRDTWKATVTYSVDGYYSKNAREGNPYKLIINSANLSYHAEYNLYEASGTKVVSVPLVGPSFNGVLNATISDGFYTAEALISYPSTGGSGCRRPPCSIEP